MRTLARILLVAAVVAVLPACAEEDEDDPSAADPDAEPAAMTLPGLPADPAGMQLSWVLTEGATADDAELADRFSADFLAQVAPEQVRTILGQLGDATVTEVRTSVPAALEAIVVAGNGASLLASILVEDAEPHRIAGLVFRPTETPRAPASWGEVDQALAALASQASFLAAEIAGDGSLVTIHDRDADVAGPLGSAFKLYVLGAVAEAVAAGTLDWDDTLTVEEADRSIPTGRLQDRVGATVTVREAATLMISISDNTAADLLLRTVGRPAVEAVLAPMGMTAASQIRSLPFLTTRELSILKWSAGPDILVTYAGAPEAERRHILADLAGELPAASAVDPARPVEVDRIEWFASPRELAAAHRFLDDRRTRPGLEPLGEILGTNPGLDVDSGTWPRVAFKGGGEPGVLSFSWLLERADGRRFAVALVAADPSRAIDEAVGAAIVGGAIDLVAATG